jgi:hypothetical protein
MLTTEIDQMADTTQTKEKGDQKETKTKTSKTIKETLASNPDNAAQIKKVEDKLTGLIGSIAGAAAGFAGMIWLAKPLMSSKDFRWLGWILIVIALLSCFGFWFFSVVGGAWAYQLWKVSSLTFSSSRAAANIVTYIIYLIIAILALIFFPHVLVQNGVFMKSFLPWAPEFLQYGEKNKTWAEFLSNPKDITPEGGLWGAKSWAAKFFRIAFSIPMAYLTLASPYAPGYIRSRWVGIVDGVNWRRLSVCMTGT